MSNLTMEDLQKLEPYLQDVVSINVNILKRKGKVLKEVLLEYSNSDVYAAELTDEKITLRPYEILRSVERSVARGHWGDWRYRGNCGGKLIKKFITFAKNYLKAPIILADAMEGSGTTRDVAKEMGVCYWGSDLRYGFDFLHDEMPVYPNTVWLHPPYYVGVNKMGKRTNMPQYSGVQYGDAPHSSDGSHITSWEEYIRWLNFIQARAYKNMQKGGLLGLLIGSSRVDGRLYDPYNSMDIYGELLSVVVKEQFNCVSDDIKYAHTNFIPIVHEYLFIIRKPDNFIIPCKVTKHIQVDLMKSEKITWKELIANIIDSLGGTASKKQILEIVKSHPKSKNNNFIQEKIRQVLNSYKNIFVRVKDDTYALKGLEKVCVA